MSANSLTPWNGCTAYSPGAQDDIAARLDTFGICQEQSLQNLTNLAVAEISYSTGCLRDPRERLQSVLLQNEEYVRYFYSELSRLFLATLGDKMTMSGAAPALLEPATDFARGLVPRFCPEDLPADHVPLPSPVSMFN